MPIVRDGKIINKTVLNNNTWLFEVECEEIAKMTTFGQFVNVLCGDALMLRRPISVSDFNDKCLYLAIEERGKGTEWICKQNAGDMLNLMGPLGNGFKVLKEKKSLIVGGGIGTAPILSIAREIGTNCDVILGFRDVDRIILREEFEKRGVNQITVCTDNGSYGIHGLVTLPLEETLKKEKYDSVYVCGPNIMMKNVSDICRKYNVNCQVSLEERMACGIGACLGCARKIKTENGYSVIRVCKDGPVFDSKEVYYE